jgi:hypothetical protein
MVNHNGVNRDENFENEIVNRETCKNEAPPISKRLKNLPFDD